MHARSDVHGAAVVTVEADALAVEFVALEEVRAPGHGGVASRTGFRVAAGSSGS